MAKRKTAPATIQNDTLVEPDSFVEEKVVQFAEQVGRILGTVQARSDGLLDRGALNNQLASIRDAAADLLKHVRPGNAPVSAAPSASGRKTRRSRGAVDAPGKRHRKPAPSTRGAKHSDTRIAKVKLTKMGRSPRRG